MEIYNNAMTLLLCYVMFCICICQTLHTTILTKTISLCSLIIILLRDTSWHRVKFTRHCKDFCKGKARGRSCTLDASSFLSTPRLDEMMQKKRVPYRLIMRSESSLFEEGFCLLFSLIFHLLRDLGKGQIASGNHYLNCQNLSSLTIEFTLTFLMGEMLLIKGEKE